MFHKMLDLEGLEKEVQKDRYKINKYNYSRIIRGLQEGYIYKFLIN